MELLIYPPSAKECSPQGDEPMKLTRENLLAKMHKLGKYPLLMSTKYEITIMYLIVSLRVH